ncbi:hypothetical protein DENSPDRAFT_324864 [Dentipellis sp. KUC8613]|nr:hypothetical protein DENSPDRAFT_324864 [Dentipellis sp. KUC8613]
MSRASIGDHPREAQTKSVKLSGTATFPSTSTPYIQLTFNMPSTVVLPVSFMAPNMTHDIPFRVLVRAPGPSITSRHCCRSDCGCSTRRSQSSMATPDQASDPRQQYSYTRANYTASIALSAASAPALSCITTCSYRKLVVWPSMRLFQSVRIRCTDPSCLVYIAASMPASALMPFDLHSPAARP